VVQKSASMGKTGLRPNAYVSILGGHSLRTAMSTTDADD